MKKSISKQLNPALAGSRNTLNRIIMKRDNVANPKICLIGICLIVALAIGLIGCGIRQETTSFYSNPSWTVGGDIIFIKTLQTVDKDFIGSQTGSSLTTSISTMSAAGANEIFWFDVTSAPPYSMTCSPTAATSEYVAYMDVLNGDLFGKIVIRNISSGTHKGLEKIELNFSPGIRSFDWSNNGQQIVYCTTSEVRITNLDGTGDTLVTAESDISFVSWKYGGRIAFVHGSPDILSLIYADKSGRLDLSAAASVTKPQISAANTNEVYGIAGGSYCKVDVSTPAITEVFANFKGDLPRLNPAADKVTYSKAGESSGIYVLDKASSWAESKIK